MECVSQFIGKPCGEKKKRAVSRRRVALFWNLPDRERSEERSRVFLVQRKKVEQGRVKSLMEE